MNSKSVIFWLLMACLIPLLGLAKEPENDIVSAGEPLFESISGQWFLAYELGSDAGTDFNRFFLKRGYITLKKDLAPGLSGRITPDISVDREGDGEGDIELRLKYCYVKYQLPDLSLFTQSYAEFGLVHRPWLDFEQHVNPFRVEGMMFVERSGILNSADYGATLITNLGGELSDQYKKTVNKNSAGKYGSLAFGFYNGGGYHAIEKNKNKTFEGRLSIRPFPEWLQGFQISYHGIRGKGNLEIAPDWHLDQVFLSFEHRRAVLTAQYIDGKGNSAGTDTSRTGVIKNYGLSLFSQVKFPFRNLSLFARYDRFRPGILEEKRYILGMSYHIDEGNKIIIDYKQLDVTNRRKSRILEFAFEVRY